MEVKVADIIRPLAKTRANDEAKVLALMTSINEIGLQGKRTNLPPTDFLTL